MAAIFFKTSTSFEVSAVEAPKPLAQQYVEKKPVAVTVGILANPEKSGVYTAFELSDSDKVDGEMSISLLESGAIKVEIRAIFKIGVKPEYEDLVLGNKSYWYFRGLPGIFGQLEVSGLKSEKYKHKRFGEVLESIRYLIPIQCASKKSGLD